MELNQHTETGSAVAAKLAPPLSVSAATLMGVPVNELVLWGTLVYTSLLITHKVYKMYRDIRADKGQRTDASDSE